MRRRSRLTAIVAAIGAVAATSWSVTASAGETTATTAQVPQAFAGAAEEFGVPEDLLKAYSLSLTGGIDRGAAPSAAGGVGLMHLTSADLVEESGRGEETPGRAQRLAADPAANTLARAAALLGEQPERLRTDPVQNIRGGAALLAAEAKKQGAKPVTLDDWLPVVRGLAGAPGATVAEGVSTTLRQGAAGGAIRLAAHGDVKTVRRATAEPAAECPPALPCAVVPAPYKSLNPADPNAYGSYDPADRPSADLPIKYIVIHDAEGTYQGTISHLLDPANATSAHYVVGNGDGEVTQMVATKDIAWHAASNWINRQSIGIEHEGFAVSGGQDYTDGLYQSSATLVRYLAAKYDIPLDREHIIGHNDVAKANNLRNSHWDPGPFFDWDRYMRMLGAPSQTPTDGPLVTVSPDFATNQPELRYCSGGCRPLAAQPTNEVLLRAEPRDDAPLFTDATVTAVGSNDITDWSNKAVTGRRYAVAERRDGWTAIWYAGQKAWLHSDVLTPSSGETIRPKPGVEAPVYTTAYPEAAEWPEGTPVEKPGNPPTNKSSYTISGDQSYPLVSTQQASAYYSRFADAAVPYDRTLIKGAQKFYRISFHHRYMYVKADDVLIG